MFKNKSRIIIFSIVTITTIIWLTLTRVFSNDALNLNTFIANLSEDQVNIINLSKDNTTDLNYYLILINIFIYLYAFAGAGDGYQIKARNQKTTYFKLTKQKNHFLNKNLLFDLTELLIYQLLNFLISLTLVLTLNLDIEVIDLLSITIYLTLIYLSLYSLTILLSYVIKKSYVKYIVLLTLFILRIIFLNLNNTILNYFNPLTMINIARTLTNNSFLLSELITNISFIIICFSLSGYIEEGLDQNG